MEKKYLLFGIALFFVVVSGMFVLLNSRLESKPLARVCTMEAKICPDGSSVGRTGPNCDFAQCPILAPTSTIAIGAKLTISGTTIGVLELVEDSRCPIDVQCIQAGTVRVRATIDAYNRDFTFTLGQPQVVGNATITLASVSPEQKFSKQTVQLSDYRFTFTVSPKVITSGPPIVGSGEHCGGFIQNAPVCATGYHCQLVVSRPDTGGTCVANTVSGGGGILPYNSGIRGTIMLGPTCPVMRDPPDPSCADKPYKTSIQVYRTDSSSIFATGNSDVNGMFEISLPPGAYTLVASGGTMLPRCSPVDAVVGQSGYASVNISCDTGIR